ncbi:endolytic transglycosylase MltG [Rhodococcus rhodnii]|uniref:Endolytic murein transglycosylase n=2 Tax=Rhodococcus rhodnii TaxID=38312 RepID=R7WKS5_9NOCA|nr:endolytic transglycosylase MltG [Rhodococcus rhodnii]EOM75911.1 hypothetical protein Rrhod_2823 [Rhodococcus rhodnii LMG 5362]TXG91071.1 endolytic transglycosylase MltG [Rhodococcus rhodnii]
MGDHGRRGGDSGWNPYRRDENPDETPRHGDQQYGDHRYEDHQYGDQQYGDHEYGDARHGDAGEPYEYEYDARRDDPERFANDETQVIPAYRDDMPDSHDGYAAGAYEGHGYEGDEYGHAPYDPDAVDTGYARDEFERDEPARDEFDPDDDWDDGSDRAAPAAVGGRAARRTSTRRRRGKVVGGLAAVLILVIGAGLVMVGGRAFFGDDPADFAAGEAGADTVIRVHPGDTAEQVAVEMADNGVVASSAAFYRAALASESMNALQPGFYSIPTTIPASEAVELLADPESRVGQIIISEGRQLHDSADVQTGAVKKGIYTLISEASCVGDSGAESCITRDELDAAGSGDPVALGVPDWAMDRVATVPDRVRQLEGLIAAGSWDFDPTASPTEILAHLVTSSAERYEETGLRSAGDSVAMSPYDLLISASLIERESMPGDFAKVSRVIVNRLEVGQPLQFDSTVNYALDTTELATTDDDRAEITPWNTYASAGLPATPIASPSIEALQAAENPEPGDWLYFVTIDAQGTTLFTHDYNLHLDNTRHALDAGILDSGR